MGFPHKVMEECLSLHSLPSTFQFPTIPLFSFMGRKLGSEGYSTIVHFWDCSYLWPSGGRDRKGEKAIKIGGLEGNVPLPQSFCTFLALVVAFAAATTEWLRGCG